MQQIPIGPPRLYKRPLCRVVSCLREKVQKMPGPARFREPTPDAIDQTGSQLLYRLFHANGYTSVFASNGPWSARLLTLASLFSFVFFLFLLEI